MSTPRIDVVSALSKVVQASNRPFSRDETLCCVTQATKDCIPGVDSVSISIKKGKGSFLTLAPTDQLARDGDSAQYELGEGPCVDAASGEQMVFSGYIRGDRRYLQYGPLAAELGVMSQLALEMYAGDRAFGGLNLYSYSTDVFDEDARNVAELFAHQGAAAMGYAATVRDLNEALASRTVIGQAMGIVAERYGVDETSAFEFLSRLSQNSNVKLRTVAAEIVESANSKVKPTRRVIVRAAE